RAGLGGLVATLRYLERARETGELSEEQLPGSPWSAGTPPWEIDESQLTFRFGMGDGAAAVFLTKLFAAAFMFRDGLIYTPGQYGRLPPPLPVRAALQDGLLRTFYDHGPQSRGLGDRLQITYEIDENRITVEYPRMEWYTHQRNGAA